MGLRCSCIVLLLVLSDSLLKSGMRFVEVVFFEVGLGILNLLS